MQMKNKHAASRNVRGPSELVPDKGNSWSKFEKNINIKVMVHKKNYKVEKGVYRVKHHKDAHKLKDFMVEVTKDYGNYILCRRAKNGRNYCITKGILICGEKELIKGC